MLSNRVRSSVIGLAALLVPIGFTAADGPTEASLCAQSGNCVPSSCFDECGGDFTMSCYIECAPGECT